MGREEQKEEREVLDSIFPDEITDISTNEYRIAITLDIPVDDTDEDSPGPILLLTVRYPEDYPDKAPNLDLFPDEAAAAHPLLNVAADRPALLAALAPVVAENLGMAMVFTLVSALKEEAEQLVARRRAAAARAHEERLLAAEREENKKFHGTPVNRATFLAWREGFLREMAEDERRREEERVAELKKARAKEPAKLTGRQLWESGLAKGEEVEEGEDESAAPAAGMDKLKVSST